MKLSNRIGFALGAAMLAALYVWWFGYTTHQLAPGGSDFDQLWFAARALLHGRDPYALIGPGREFRWPWPLVYPLSTVVAVLPLTALPVVVARIIFASLSVGILTFALTKRGAGVLPVVASAAVLDAARAGQLSLLLTAGVLLTGASFAFALKPHTGLALLAAAPRRRAIVVAAITGVALTIIAFAFQPHWLASWRNALGSASHVRIPLFALGGPLLLLALLRWRRLDARVLLACACVPHTPIVYDVVPIGLVARNFRESLMFALLTYAALLAQHVWVTNAPPSVAATLAARILNVTVYLPALLAVLARPNVSEEIGASNVGSRATTYPRDDDAERVVLSANESC